MRALPPCVALALLSACASAPREPAGRLADAGTQATGALASDVRSLARRLEYGDVLDAFARTYYGCAPDAPRCVPQLAASPLYEERRQLADTIALRGQALSALQGAYEALEAEADYDGRADLAGAANEAVSGVNSFAMAVSALPGAGAAKALISEPLQAIISYGAGILGDRSQRRRLLAASRDIRLVTARMRDALIGEANATATIMGEVENERFATREALLKANLISNAELLKPMTDELGVKVVPNADAIVAKSPTTQAAVLAAVRAMSRADTIVIQNRYRAAIDALNGLVRAHADLERKRPLSLADVERSLAELDAALGKQLPKEE